MIKVLVTGSRELKNFQQVYDALDDIYEDTNEPVLVIHGGAKGADSYADHWVKYRPRAQRIVVPAEWDRDGVAAGPIRNERMLGLSPDIVLAFFQVGAKNSGTSHMAKLTRNAGIKMIVYTLD